MIDMSTDQIVFWTVVAARILIPLAVPLVPLPADARCARRRWLDQTIFQTFTALPLDDYAVRQSMMRNWVSRDELSRRALTSRVLLPAGRRRPLRAVRQIRACCSSSPTRSSTSSTRTTAIRTRWDRATPREHARSSGSPAFIWIFIRADLRSGGCHVAELDATDLIKTKSSASTAAAADATRSPRALPRSSSSSPSSSALVFAVAGWSSRGRRRGLHRTVHAGGGRRQPMVEGGHRPDAASSASSTASDVGSAPRQLLATASSSRRPGHVHLQHGCCRGADPAAIDIMRRRRARGRARARSSVACSSCVATAPHGRESSSSRSRWLSTLAIVAAALRSGP